MIEIDELLEFLKRRRSCRRFKPDPIPDEWVNKVIEAARWAPSGANAQPWEFIIVKDQKVKDAMADAYMEIRPDHYYMEQTKSEEYRHNNLKHMPTGRPSFQDAPAVVVVLGDRRAFQASVIAGTYIGSGGSTDSTYQKGMANAVFSMHLAAAALGIGAQWFSGIDDWAALLRPILGFPPAMHVHVIVPLGYPAEPPKGGYRRKFEDIVHHDHYDMSKYRSEAKMNDFIRELRGRTKTAYDANPQNKKV